MTNISLTHEPCDQTATSPSAWSAGRRDEAQSQTFRALAWSQEDSLDEPLRYTGEQDAPEADSHPTARIADVEARSGLRRSTLLFGIAGAFAAAAVGGLVFTVVGTGGIPTTTSPVVVQGGAIHPPAAAKTVATTAGSPAHAVAPPANTVTAMPAPAPPRPTRETTAPETTAPEATAPEVTAPVVGTPQPTPPGTSAPQPSPAVPAPPAAAPPVVSVPEATPQQVPHPVGPPTFHVPVAPESGMAPMPQPVVTPVIQVPLAPAASNPGITLKPGVTVPLVIPTFSIGPDH